MRQSWWRWWVDTRTFLVDYLIFGLIEWIKWPYHRFLWWKWSIACFNIPSVSHDTMILWMWRVLETLILHLGHLSYFASQLTFNGCRNSCSRPSDVRHGNNSFFHFWAVFLPTTTKSILAMWCINYFMRIATITVALDELQLKDLSTGAM
jgi:hypothetical protein